MDRLEELKNIEVLLNNAKIWIGNFETMDVIEKNLKRLVNEHIYSAQDFTNRLMKKIK